MQACPARFTIIANREVGTLAVSDRKIVQGLTEAWCIAKIRRLVGPLGPPIDKPDYEEEFQVKHL